MATKADWKKSVGKFLGALLIFWLTGKFAPEQIVGILPADIRSITLGAAVLALINYLKHTEAGKKVHSSIPILNKIL